MNRFVSSFLLFCMLHCCGVAQEYINLSVDNDLYFGYDWYYSSGIFVSTGKQIKEAETQDDFPKKYRHWTFGQEIYTPSKRYTRNVHQFDYPYGGWIFIARSFEKYKDPFSAWGYSIKAGMTGEASLAPLFQNLYHRHILDLPEVAWEQPLPQRFHLNLNGSHRKRLAVANRVAFLYEFFANMGTQRMAMGGRMGLLLGPSDALSFLGNQFETQRKGYGVYLGTRQEYRFHDFMISGSLFDDEAPFVLSSIPYKNSLEIGFAYYSPKWRFLTIFNSVSKDNDLQSYTRHPYLNLTIGRIF